MLIKNNLIVTDYFSEKEWVVISEYNNADIENKKDNFLNLIFRKYTRKNIPSDNRTLSAVPAPRFNINWFPKKIPIGELVQSILRDVYNELDLSKSQIKEDYFDKGYIIYNDVKLINPDEIIDLIEHVYIGFDLKSSVYLIKDSTEYESDLIKQLVINIDREKLEEVYCKQINILIDRTSSNEIIWNYSKNLISHKIWRTEDKIFTLEKFGDAPGSYANRISLHTKPYNINNEFINNEIKPSEKLLSVLEDVIIKQIN